MPLFVKSLNYIDSVLGVLYNIIVIILPLRMKMGVIGKSVVIKKDSLLEPFISNSEVFNALFEVCPKWLVLVMHKRRSTVIAEHYWCSPGAEVFITPWSFKVCIFKPDT